MKLRSTILAGLLSSVAAPLWAQPAGPALGSVLSVGSRVRLKSDAIGGEHRGLVVSLDEGALTLASDGGGVPLKLPLASITAADASLGRKRHTLQGAAVGAAVGLALGLGYSVNPDDCGVNSENFCSRGEALAGGSLGGAGLGALVGALIKTDRWAPITLRAANARGRRDARSFGLGVAVRF
jgi:hypothetical protein